MYATLKVLAVERGHYLRDEMFEAFLNHVTAHGKRDAVGRILRAAQSPSEPETGASYA